MKKPIVWVALAVAVVFAIMLYRFQPKDSAEAAGWVQAFGTLAAIGLSVWLQSQANSAGQRRAEMVARAFSGQILNALDALQLACRNPSEIDLKLAQRILEDTLKVKVDVGDLTPQFIAMVLTVRAIAIQASEYRTRQINWLEWDTAFGNLAVDARNAMRKTGLKPPDKGFSP